MMRIITPFACLVLLQSFAATVCWPARAADLDGAYAPPPSSRSHVYRRYRRLPPPAVIYAPAQANPQDLRFYPRAPFVEQPFLVDPYAPSIFGAPLSPPTYGYGY